MTVDVYRIWTSHSRPNSGWGEREYVEGYDEMVEQVTLYAIEAAGHRERERHQGRLSVKWWRERIRPTDADDSPVVSKVTVAQLVEGEWVDLEFILHEPRIEFITGAG